MAHRDDAPVNLSLFAPEVPDGFEYRADFVTSVEQSDLLDHIAMTEFSNFEMRGVVARRRVAFFGSSYDDDRPSAGEIPAFLHPVRARAAAWAGVAPEAFEMALINEYRPGAPIGWHRDAPQYGIIAGISLASPCQMRFRPYARPSARRPASHPAPRKTTHEVLLESRSAYLITGASRQQYEHSIPAVAALRYSITFRTRRADRPSILSQKKHMTIMKGLEIMKKHSDSFFMAYMFHVLHVVLF